MWQPSARGSASSHGVRAVPEQPTHGRGSLAFGGAISSLKAVTLPVQSSAAPGDAGAGADHGDAGDREAGQERHRRGRRGPARRRSAVEVPDIDHLQFDACF
jgi:hypothetical protein